jgi:hypothetical protein
LHAENAKVVNLGVEGYGITQIYVRFHQIQERLIPGDIVILTFINDDVSRNWRDFLFVSRMLFGTKPIKHYPVFDNGSIGIQETGSHLHRMKALLVNAPWMGSLFGPLLLPPPRTAITDALRMVNEIRAAAERRGAKFLLVQLPTGRDLRKNYSGLDLSRLNAVRIENRFPSDSDALQGLFLAEDDDHYSPGGHHLVGEILFQEVVTRGWVAAKAARLRGRDLVSTPTMHQATCDVETRLELRD